MVLGGVRMPVLVRARSEAPSVWYALFVGKRARRVSVGIYTFEIWNLMAIAAVYVTSRNKIFIDGRFQFLRGRITGSYREVHMGWWKTPWFGRSMCVWCVWACLWGLWGERARGRKGGRVSPRLLVAAFFGAFFHPRLGGTRVRVAWRGLQECWRGERSVGIVIIIVVGVEICGGRRKLWLFCYQCC